MGCSWAVPGMKAGACMARAGCDRLRRFLWTLHPSCCGGLDFGGEDVSRWSCLLMFPGDLQCRRMLRSCVEAAGVYGLWEGSLSHPSFTVLHGPVGCMGQKLRLPAWLPRKTDCSSLLGRLGGWPRAGPSPWGHLRWTQQLGVHETCHRDGHGVNPPLGPQLKPVLKTCGGRRWHEVVAVLRGGMKME